MKFDKFTLTYVNFRFVSRPLTVTMQDKNDKKIFIRKCSRPEPKVTEIYNALGYNHYPFLKKSVLPETVSRKNQNNGSG